MVAMNYLKPWLSSLLTLFCALNVSAQPTIVDVKGDFSGDRLGRDVVLPGDLNGDNIPDIVAISNLADSSEGANDNVGILKAISGSDKAVRFNVRGDFEQDFLGLGGVHLPGDLNGDNVPDLVAVSFFADSSAGANDNVGIVKAISGTDGEVLFNVRGDFAQDFLGMVFLPGDLNGDNIPDLVAISPNADSSAGANDDVGIVKVISGVDGEVLFNVRGDFSEDKLGLTGLHLPGDLNRDDIPDLVVVSSAADSSAGANDNVGIVKVISGIDGEILFNVRGDFTQDELGEAFLPGDLNGDNIPDIVATSQSADSSEGAGNNVGVVKAISGIDGEILYNVRGDFSEDRLGRTDIYLPGDLNGDNIPDLVATSAFADSSEGAGDNVGIAKAISGESGQILFNVRGDFTSDQIGSGGSFLPGDLNGDNVPDFIIIGTVADSSERANDSVGIVKVISGSNGTVLFNVRGDFRFDQLGRGGVFLPGDLNGDGIPDLIAVSDIANSSEGASNDVGIVKAISGSNGQVLFNVRGDFTNDSLGVGGVFFPGDLNQDNVPDLAVVSSKADSSEGANDDVGIVKAISGSNGEVLFNVRGNFSNEKLGSSNALYLPGDLNGNGLPELIATSLADSSEGAGDNVGLVKIIMPIPDQCPADPFKVEPGVCGCGVADIDADSDGSFSCNDQCDSDPQKTAPGGCGCGFTDIDKDGDGAFSCNEECDNDPLKTAPGICGCGIPDTDTNANGVVDCLEDDVITPLDVLLLVNFINNAIDLFDSLAQQGSFLTKLSTFNRTIRSVRVIESYMNENSVGATSAGLKLNKFLKRTLKARKIARRISFLNDNSRLNSRKLDALSQKARRRLIRMRKMVNNLS